MKLAGLALVLVCTFGGLLIAMSFEVDKFMHLMLLIGKAFLVYWPHGWNVGKIPLPLIPNVFRMGRIR